MPIHFPFEDTPSLGGYLLEVVIVVAKEGCVSQSCFWIVGEVVRLEIRSYIATTVLPKGDSLG